MELVVAGNTIVHLITKEVIAMPDVNEFAPPQSGVGARRQGRSRVPRSKGDYVNRSRKREQSKKDMLWVTILAYVIGAKAAVLLVLSVFSMLTFSMNGTPFDWLVIMILTGLGLAMGVGSFAMIKRYTWGYPVAWIFAIFSLLGFPVFTFFGIMALIKLPKLSAKFNR